MARRRSGAGSRCQRRERPRHRRQRPRRLAVPARHVAVEGVRGRRPAGGDPLHRTPRRRQLGLCQLHLERRRQRGAAGACPWHHAGRARRAGRPLCRARPRRLSGLPRRRHGAGAGLCGAAAGQRAAGAGGARPSEEPAAATVEAAAADRRRHAHRARRLGPLARQLRPLPPRPRRGAGGAAPGAARRRPRSLPPRGAGVASEPQRPLQRLQMPPLGTQRGPTTRASPSSNAGSPTTCPERNIEMDKMKTAGIADAEPPGPAGRSRQRDGLRPHGGGLGRSGRTRSHQGEKRPRSNAAATSSPPAAATTATRRRRWARTAPSRT